MTKRWLPITYTPKIEPVLNKEITQTIRVGSTYKVGDEIAFHGWENKPYRSKWSFRTPYWKIVRVEDILIWSNGIQICTDDNVACFYEWHWRQCEDIARSDGITPATGEELGRVLTSMHKIPENGLEAQIIRWLS